MNAELVQTLQTELNRLNGQVQAMREAGFNQNEIEQHTNVFEGEWQERLVEAQKVETSGAEIGVAAAFEERDRQARNQADTRDAQQLPGMTEKDQVAYWASNRTGNGVSQEQQRAQETSRAVEQATKQISNEYQNLGRTLTRALVQIELGIGPGGPSQKLEGQLKGMEDGPTSPPPASRLVAQQMDKENTPAPAKEQVEAQQRDRTAPAPAVDLSQETWKQYQSRMVQEGQAPQRQAQELAQEQERQRALER